MKIYSLAFLIAFLAACKPPQKQAPVKKAYFDLAQYFNNEATRLTKLSPVISKTVSQNQQAESKHLTISNWAAEMELFASSDINKPAWKDSYQTKHQGHTLDYIANDKDLKTQSIRIIKSPSDKIIEISIRNKTSNTLYSSTENLRYIPDSLYNIDKKQDVLVIGTNSYSITGKFKN